MSLSFCSLAAGTAATEHQIVGSGRADRAGSAPGRSDTGTAPVRRGAGTGPGRAVTESAPGQDRVGTGPARDRAGPGRLKEAIVLFRFGKETAGLWHGCHGAMGGLDHFIFRNPEKLLSSSCCLLESCE